MCECTSSAALGCTQRCHITITSGDPVNSLPFITLQPLCLKVLLLPRTADFAGALCNHHHAASLGCLSWMRNARPCAKHLTSVFTGSSEKTMQHHTLESEKSFRCCGSLSPTVT